MAEPNFVEKINFVRKASLGVPRSLVIDLSIVATDKPYEIAGNIFYIMAAPDSSSYVDVRFNEVRESPIRLYHQMGFETPFYRLFITTPAGQTGNITILYATEAPEYLKIIDNRSATSLDLQGVRQAVELVRDELRGDTTPQDWGTEKTVGIAAVEILNAETDRKSAFIQSKQVNTGLIYVGFDNTVSTSKWVAELQPGAAFSVDDYRGPLFAISDTAGQLVGWGEW